MIYSLIPKINHRAVDSLHFSSESLFRFHNSERFMAERQAAQVEECQHVIQYCRERDGGREPSKGGTKIGERVINAMITALGRNKQSTVVSMPAQDWQEGAGPGTSALSCCCLLLRVLPVLEQLWCNTLSGFSFEITFIYQNLSFLFMDFLLDSG